MKVLKYTEINCAHTVHFFSSFHPLHFTCLCVLPLRANQLSKLLADDKAKRNDKRMTLVRSEFGTGLHARLICSWPLCSA